MGGVLNNWCFWYSRVQSIIALRLYPIFLLVPPLPASPLFPHPHRKPISYTLTYSSQIRTSSLVRQLLLPRQLPRPPLHLLHNILNPDRSLRHNAVLIAILCVGSLISPCPSNSPPQSSLALPTPFNHLFNYCLSLFLFHQSLRTFHSLSPQSLPRGRSPADLPAHRSRALTKHNLDKPSTHIIPL